MNRRETERIVDAIRRAQAAGEQAAIATVVRVRGSAYRREGARILVRQDGTYECLLSGGCLEPAVADAAARVIETGTPTVTLYDLEDDSVWGLGIGCSGAVDIRIERVDNDPIARQWLQILDAADTGVLVTTVLGGPGRLLVREDEAIGTLGDVLLDAAAAARARDRLRAGFPHSGKEFVEETELFFDISVPPPELVLFGAGFDAEPVARQGYDLGFDVTVVDPREAFLSAARFPHIRLIPAHFGGFAAAVRLTSRSFVVVMNHHLERDRESLRFALESPAPYIGLLGPRSRLERLLGALRAGGYVPRAEAIARVRNPIGLAVGAETPVEIAVSILGEILALQRGFEGGFLDGRVDSLHRSGGSRLFARS
jgi:xanthine/CO dehydrogenase XdhC/CoxF family maturation factor